MSHLPLRKVRVDEGSHGREPATLKAVLSCRALSRRVSELVYDKVQGLTHVVGCQNIGP